MRYTLLVTGPPYGTQNSSTALLFAHALLDSGHELQSIFFYREGVFNANCLTQPASDETDIVRKWENLHKHYNVALNVCLSAALRRGVMNNMNSKFIFYNDNNNNEEKVKSTFTFGGLGILAEALLKCDRLVQF